MEKLVLDRKSAAEVLGVSLPILDTFINREADPLPSFKAGRRVMIPVDTLRAWLANETVKAARGA